MSYNSDDAAQPLIEVYDNAHGDVAGHRQVTRNFMTTKTKHYIVMALVALDVTSALAEMSIGLISCDLSIERDPWVKETEEILHVVELAFSVLFLLELLATIWAFGIRFFTDWFHCLDAIIIVTSFLVDFLSHGVLGQIASLVIILRLWRLVKIIEEVSAGSSERVEDVESRLEDLRRENSELRNQVRSFSEQHGILENDWGVRVN